MSYDLSTPSPKRPRYGGAGGGMGGGVRLIRNGDSGKGAVWKHSAAYARLRPTADAKLVFRQLRLGLMNWCMFENASGVRLTGTLNQQLVRTLSQNVANFMEPATVVSSRLASFVGLHKVLRDSYSFGAGGANTRDDTFTPVVSGSGAAVARLPVPRQTWELGTCWQYRDYLQHCYGMGTSLAAANVLAGYLPPHYDGATNYLMGRPDVSAPGNRAYPRTVSTADTGTGDLPTDQWQNAVMRRVFEETTPVFLAYEEIEWTFTNPTEQAMDIYLYELVARSDVPLVGTPLKSVAGVEDANIVNYGRWPDPVYLFQKDLDASQVSYVAPGAPTTATTIVPVEGQLGEQNGPQIHFDDVPGSSIVVGASSVYQQGQPRRMTYDPHMQPRGTNVGMFYRVGVKHIHIDAGARATYRCRVHHNRSLGFDDIFGQFARAGRARQYMMVVRGERLVSAATAGATQAQDSYRQPDVIVEWNKSAKFCRFRMRPLLAHSTVRRAVRTDITTQYDMDPVSGDYEAAGGPIAP